MFIIFQYYKEKILSKFSAKIVPMFLKIYWIGL